MKLIFNPTGTHVKQNIKTDDKFLKVRIDFFPEETEKTYQLHYVYVPVFPETGYPGKVDKEGNPIDQNAYNMWVASLPHIWKLNPAICCFFTVPENIQEADFLHELDVRFKPDDIATMDNFMILPDSAHYASAFNKTRLKLTSDKIFTSDIEDLKSTINQRFASIQELKPSSGISLDIQPQSIDVGTEAINRGSTGSSDIYVTPLNPVNADGTINTIEIWLSTSATGVEVGMVSMNGNDATTRDYFVWGNVASGSKQTASAPDDFTALSCITGDFIGYSNDGTGVMERDYSGDNLWYITSGTAISDLSSTTMSNTDPTDYTISLYGTGTESGGGGWTNIAKVGGVTATDLAKVDGIAVADIAKINGVAV